MKHFFFSEIESSVISESLGMNEDDIFSIPLHLSYGDLTEGWDKPERVSFLESDWISSEINTALPRLYAFNEKTSEEVCIWYRMNDSDALLGFCFLCDYLSDDIKIYVQSYPYDEYFKSHNWGTGKDESFIKACWKNIRHLSKEERLAASDVWKDNSIQKGIFRRVIDSEVQNVPVNYYDRIIKNNLNQFPEDPLRNTVGRAMAEINEPVADDWLLYRARKLKASINSVLKADHEQ